MSVGTHYIVHDSFTNFKSIVATSFSCFDDEASTFGHIVYSCMILLTMHFLFNVKIGRKIFGKKVFPLSVSSKSVKLSLSSKRNTNVYRIKRMSSKIGVISSPKVVPINQGQLLEDPRLSMNEKSKPVPSGECIPLSTE